MRPSSRMNDRTTSDVWSSEQLSLMTISSGA
jgi:hypothetical protein